VTVTYGWPDVNECERAYNNKPIKKC